MKKIRVSVSTNRVGSTVTREFEIDDNATEEEINEEAWECACDMIDYGWEEVQHERIFRRFRYLAYCLWNGYVWYWKNSAIFV